MKVQLRILAWCICCLVTITTPCPTCIGRMEESHPPLFTQEYEATYRHTTDSAESIPNNAEAEELNDEPSIHSS